MGCCLSTGDRHPEAENRRSCGGARPRSPPAAPEEEAVKEVLLETTVAPKVDERIKGTPLGDRGLKVEAGPKAVIHGNPDPPGKADVEIVCEVSEVSEMGSYSESFSNATAQEKRDDDEDGVVNQRPPPRKRRVPAGGRGRAERVVARRAAAPSPEKRGQVTPLRPARGRAMAGQPRNVAEENGRRRDPGEGSGRKSPVRRVEEGGRRNVGDEKSAATPEPPNDVVAAEEAESLENPVVSLECFIFL
ncbi:uncharacterized protein LOC105167352 [Sesamum indicum]|uniref:Uncharacterized protein LOC105167352 n=1 Tax=Sesamum indicum TaxID=4182 RepID=A0A6I9TPK0_SESIN|nr:uncharacterized protein LOC105167352 [Sesamum indicum]